MLHNEPMAPATNKKRKYKTTKETKPYTLQFRITASEKELLDRLKSELNITMFEIRNELIKIIQRLELNTKNNQDEINNHQTKRTKLMINIKRNGRAVSVPADIIKNWKLKYRHGDYQLISEQSGVHRATVIRAFRGEAQPELINFINIYYEPITA